MRTNIFLACLIAAVLVSIMPVSAGTITVNASNIGSSFITWSWPGGLSISNESFDGNMIYTFDPNANNFTLSGLPPNESHTFCVYTPVSGGCNTTMTAPDTSVYANLTGSVDVWFYTVLIVIFLIAAKKLHWFCYPIAFVISLYALGSYVYANPSMTTNIWHLPFLIYGFLFIFTLVLWARKGR